MRIKLPSTSRGGYALLTVLVMAGVASLIFAGIAHYASTNVSLNDRNNTYNSTVAAAEAATETAVSYLQRDFARQTFDYTDLDDYREAIPTNDWAANYRFTDTSGHSNKMTVTSSAAVVTNLNSQFEGLYGLVFNCRIRSQASPLGSPYDLSAGVQQDLQLASIPVFQFAIFYSMDLEINPGAAMKITGKVHSNATLYNSTSASLEYLDDVAAVGRILNARAPCDPESKGNVKPIYRKEALELASALTLPIATNNSPLAVRAILEPPPFGEDPGSQMGRARYHNLVDLIVRVKDYGTFVSAGSWNLFNDITNDIPAVMGAKGAIIAPARYSFITNTESFYDQREKKWTRVIDLNVAALNKWMTNISATYPTNAGAQKNAQAQYNLGHSLNSIYILDDRTADAAKPLSVVRVNNGQYLPASGLTVATPLPLYVRGHFNAPITTAGSTNTMTTKPASLVADAITVLSGAWSDANSDKAIASRVPTDTTVNAAFLAGIVPTVCAGGTKHYSGGVENFPRFLENWSGRTFTYNGSMVVMFPSQYATAYWPGTGSIYNAPTRKWAFDQNFLEYDKLPPATPQVRKLVRGQWTVLAGN